MYTKFLFLSLGAENLGLEGIIQRVFSYLRHTCKLEILSCLSDFMTCCERFNVYSEAPYLSFGTLKEHKI